MHGANHYYGHAHIMARYAGLRAPLIIDGYLQHGWNVHDGLAIGTHVVPGSKLFVWSDAVMRRGWSLGRRNYHVIGAPWSYLLTLESSDEADAPDRDGTIFYPFHGWEGQNVTGDHQAMLRTLQEVEQGPLTVCLYWVEFENPAIRQVYLEGGCRVITHGRRGFAYRGTQPNFLRRQLAELRRHRRVVSNRLSSAIFYGASVGCDVAVYGDPMLLTGEHQEYGGVERLVRAYPDLHREHVLPTVAREIARSELGIDKVRCPSEIRHLFGWRKPRGSEAA